MIVLRFGCMFSSVSFLEVCIRNRVETSGKHVETGRKVIVHKSVCLDHRHCWLAAHDMAQSGVPRGCWGRTVEGIDRAKSSRASRAQRKAAARAGAPGLTWGAGRPLSGATCVGPVTLALLGLTLRPHSFGQTDQKLIRARKLSGGWPSAVVGW